jgi:hypothetical protein
MERTLPRFALWGAVRARVLAMLTLALVCLIVAAPAAAQTKSPRAATARAKAVVLTPLTLLKTADLNFGRIIARNVAGTVEVNSTTGVCTYTVVSGIGTCAAAQFAGRANNGTTVRISLVSNTNLTGPGQTMVLDTIKVSGLAGTTFTGNGNSNGQGLGLSAGNGNQRYSINSSSGIFNFGIGGTLRVNANQAPGVYRGTVTISVQYN